MSCPAVLRLSNGKEFRGFSFGYEKSCQAEVVFSTATVGYPESLTDPSYKGQILCLTYPIIGNYGIPGECLDKNNLSLRFESETIKVSALVVSDFSNNFSHWQASQSLQQWLIDQKIPAIYGIDTRELTKILRDNGSMRASLIIGDGKIEEEVSSNPVAQVSCAQLIEYKISDKAKTVVVVDCGIKHSILRYLISKGVNVIRVPWNYDFSNLSYDGIFISNGPGGVENCKETVNNIKVAIGKDKPIFGMDLGNLILAKAAGAEIIRLKSGHHGHNQPVERLSDHKCLITSQNHNFAVDASTLPKDWKAYFVNMNDNSCEGVRHCSKPFFALQFTLEAMNEPTDLAEFFDSFISSL